jgi:hypothetical protein
LRCLQPRHHGSGVRPTKAYRVRGELGTLSFITARRRPTRYTKANDPESRPSEARKGQFSGSEPATDRPNRQRPNCSILKKHNQSQMPPELLPSSRTVIPTQVTSLSAQVANLQLPSSLSRTLADIEPPKKLADEADALIKKWSKSRDKQTLPTARPKTQEYRSQAENSAPQASNVQHHRPAIQEHKRQNEILATQEYQLQDRVSPSRV